MDSRSPQAFDSRYLVAFGAGLAAALLCLVARQGTLPAYFLAYFTPLPIMIATVGFGAMPGLAAALVGTTTIIVYVAARPGDFWTARLLSAALLGGIFAVTLGLPAWWLARLARLTRTDEGSWRDAARLPVVKGEARVFYPVGRILASGVVVAFAIITLTVLAIVLDEGGFDAIIDRLAAKLAPYVLDFVGTRELPAGVNLQDLSRFYVRLMPPVATYVYLLLVAANLWLAARVAQVSNLLVRPWPDIAQELRLPRPFALALLASAALSALDGLTGTIAACAAAALGIGFALQGLAVIHALTRNLKFRAALLAAIYAAAALLPLMLFPLATVGLLDAGFSFRARKALAAPQNT